MKGAKGLSIKCKTSKQSKSTKNCNKNNNEVMVFVLNQKAETSTYKLNDRLGYAGVIGTFKLND